MALLVAACLAAAAATRPWIQAVSDQVILDMEGGQEAMSEKELMRQRGDCDPEFPGDVCILRDTVTSKKEKGLILKIGCEKSVADAIKQVCYHTPGAQLTLFKALCFAYVDLGQDDPHVVARMMAGVNGIEWAEQNHVVEGTPEKDVDFQASELSSASTSFWHLQRIAASERKNQGEGVHAYIVDSGIFVGHSDFGGRAIPGYDWMDGTPKDCQPGDLACAQDLNGHGTHVAGSVGGATFGVAPKATLYAVRVLNDQGIGSFFSAIGGMDHVAASDKRPAVVTMSLGAPGTDMGMTFAVSEVIKLGVTVVVASGNENADACGYTPNNVPGAIVVGATDRKDALAWYSNYGSCVDIYAPGDNIMSCRHNQPEGGGLKSGTSMACPLVAGAAALLLEEQPTLKPDEVLRELQAKAGENYIELLSGEDQNNLLLNVGADAPPPVAEGQRQVFNVTRWNGVWAPRGGPVLSALLVWSFGF